MIKSGQVGFIPFHLTINDLAQRGIHKIVLQAGSVELFEPLIVEG